MKGKPAGLLRPSNDTTIPTMRQLQPHRQLTPANTPTQALLQALGPRRAPQKVDSLKPNEVRALQLLPAVYTLPNPTPVGVARLSEVAFNQSHMLHLLASHNANQATANHLLASPLACRPTSNRQRLSSRRQHRRRRKSL